MCDVCGSLGINLNPIKVAEVVRLLKAINLTRATKVVKAINQVRTTTPIKVVSLVRITKAIIITQGIEAEGEEVGVVEAAEVGIEVDIEVKAELIRNGRIKIISIIDKPIIQVI